MNSRYIGFAAAIVSAAIMGTFGVLVRHVSVDGSVIALARFALGFLFLAVFVLLSGNGNSCRVTLSPALILSGIFLAFCVLCYSQAIKTIPLTHAVFLLYLAPLIASVLGYVFLNEKINFFKALFLLLAFAGSVCLLGLNFSGDFANLHGKMLAMASAANYAFFMICNRKISEKVSGLGRAFYQLLFGAMVLLPFSANVDVENLYHDRYGLIAIGFFQGFGAISLMILSLRYLQAYEYATVSYVEPIVASVAGYLIYRESPSWVQGLGCLLILVSGIMQIRFSLRTASRKE